MAQRIATTTIPMMVCNESDWFAIELFFTLNRYLMAYTSSGISSTTPTKSSTQTHKTESGLNNAVKHVFA